MLLHYIIAMAIAVLAIVLGIILGDYGPWYFSWFLGTGFMVLVAVASGIFLEAQEDADANETQLVNPAKAVVGSSAVRNNG